MRVRLTKVAIAELNEIYVYITNDNPSAARAVVRQVEYVIDRIRDFPEMARSTNDEGVRIFPVMPFPYLVFYTVGRGEVIIRNVRHAGRIRP